MDLKYFIGKIVIEDFIPGGNKDKQSNIDLVNIDYHKSMIKLDQNLRIRRPRDLFVWCKTKPDRNDLRRAKYEHKKLMLRLHSGYTNKSDFYTQKALIWS